MTIVKTELEMEDRFKILDGKYEHKDTVISFFSSMFKVGELILLASEIFRDIGLGELNVRVNSQGRGKIPIGKDLNQWLNDGKECEILSPDAKGWQKGKVRIKVTLEFCPDEPEVLEIPVGNNTEISQTGSPLDDIRQMMNQDSL